MGQLTTLDIEPGIVTERTARTARGQWKDGDKIRFRNGVPEKIGGWKKRDVTAFQGLARALHDWTSLDGERWLAIGTHLKLYLVNNDTLYDITPIEQSGQLTDPFSTTNGDETVSVASTGHNVQVGNFVHFENATAVGGLDLNGEHRVATVVDADNYTIEADSAATSTDTGGGTVDYEYEIDIGTGSTETLFGYGSSTYGSSTYGTPRSESGLQEELRIWALDNWGEDLMATYNGGRVYHWDHSNGTGTRAQLVSNSPTTNQRIFVAPDARILVSLGAHTGSADDQQLVRWTDTEDFNDWTPTDTNTAGDFRATRGSQLVAYQRTRLETLLFTDESVYSMRLIGGNNVFSFDVLAEQVAIAGPNACVEVNGLVFFMGQRDFFTYDGVVRPLPCAVRNHVFDDINRAQLYKVYAAVNQNFNEIWWLYPCESSEEPDKYVIYNYVDRVWYFGNIDRTAMHDRSALYLRPYGVDSSGNLYRHEDGNNDDTAALTSYIESWDIELGEGDYVMRVTRLIPDPFYIFGEVDVTLRARRYPTGPQQVKGPYTFTESTKKLNLRLRGRQVAIRMGSDAKSDNWRMGPWRVEMAPHGKR